MTAQDAFIRKIVEDPFDDTHRLVYADWLDEQGDEESAHRAFWIRHLITGRTEPYDQDAVTKSINIIQGESPGSPFPRRVVWGPTNLLGINQCWSFDRGFVSEVTCSTEALLGGACGRCGGTGVYFTMANGSEACAACNETGRTEGVAKALFLAHPITSVRLAGKVVDVIDAERCWIKERPGVEECYLTAFIPADVFAELKGGRPESGGGQWAGYFGYDDEWMIYPHDLAANKALSRAVVDRCRRIADLPELEWPGE